MKPTWKRLILVSVVTITLWPTLLCAQARSRYRWKTPTVGGISTVGGDFSTYSSGVGGLRGAGAGMPTGILKTSLVSNYNLRRSSGGAANTGTLGTALPKLSDTKGQSYGSTKINLNVPPGGGTLPKTTMDINRAPATSGAQSELASKAGHTTTSSTSQPQKIEPIFSFVPSVSGRYQEYMKQGDQAFRAERFIESSDAFDVASAMGRYLPESHLSLVHAYFAQGRYYSAAYHLRRTLKYFPDLPMVSLRVRLFYGRTETFVGHVDKLRQDIQDSAPDAGLLLLLGYIRYFDGDEADAAKVLRRAWVIGKDDQAVTEAIETFWSGMVAAGKVEGALGATTRPPSPAPAGQDEPADKQVVPPPPTTPQPPVAPAGEDAKKRAEKNSPEKGQDDK